MFRLAGLAAVMWLSVSGVAQAAGPPVPPAVQATAVPAGSPLRSVEFARVDVRIASGASLGTTALGLICFPTAKAYYQSPRDVLTDQYLAVFNDVMKTAGFKVAGDPTNMFETASANGDYAIGAQSST